MTGISATLVKQLRDLTNAGVIDCKKALTETHGDLVAAVERLREADLAKAAKKADRVAAEGLVALVVEESRGAIVELNTETEFVARTEAFRHVAASLARIALTVGGDLGRLLNASAPDGEGLVSDMVARLSARTGERVYVRRSAQLSASHGIVASYVHNTVAPGLGSIGALVALESPATADALREIGRRIAMHVAASSPLWVSQEQIPAEVVAEQRATLLAQARKSGKPEAIVEKMVDGRLRKHFDEVVLGLQPFVMNPDERVADALTEAEKAAGAPIAVAAFVRFKAGEGVEQTPQ